MSKTIDEIKKNAEQDILKTVANALKKNGWNYNFVAASELGVTPAWLSRYIRANRSALIEKGVRQGYTKAWRS